MPRSRGHIGSPCTEAAAHAMPTLAGVSVDGGMAGARLAFAPAADSTTETNESIGDEVRGCASLHRQLRNNPWQSQSFVPGPSPLALVLTPTPRPHLALLLQYAYGRRGPSRPTARHAGTPQGVGPSRNGCSAPGLHSPLTLLFSSHDYQDLTDRRNDQLEENCRPSAASSGDRSRGTSSGGCV
jgi:hypothetical protein